MAHDMQASPPLTVGMLTCSFSGDIDVFRMLCETTDRFAGPPVRHLVVTPRADLALFAPFARAGRDIVAQEDFLPRWLWRPPLPSPRWRRRLFLPRRDVFLSWRSPPVRGWIAQQILKLEAARQADWDVVLHVDSDAAFIRRLDPDRLTEDGRIRLYRKEGAGETAMHAPWHLAAARLLGLPPRPYFGADFIDNLVTWRPAVARALVARIADATGLDWRVALARTPTFSEYILYGVFCDQILGADSRHAGNRDSLCHTQWSEGDDSATATAAFVAGVAPQHIAIGVQSTASMPMAARRALLDRCIAAAGRDAHSDSLTEQGGDFGVINAPDAISAQAGGRPPGKPSPERA